MIAAGLTGLLAIANEKTDHLWIVLAEESIDPLAVLVMLTDARIVENANLILDVGIPLTPNFTRTKRSTVDFARSRRVDWAVLRNLVDGPHFYNKGHLSKQTLSQIRASLLASPHTPVDVLEYARGRAWQKP